MKAALSVLCALLLLCASTAAEAQEPRRDRLPAWLYEVRFAVLSHDVDDLWSGDRREGGIDWNAELVFGREGWSLLRGTVRPQLGVSVNDQGDTSKAYAGLLWEFEADWGGFFATGIGAAIHNGELDTNDPDRKELGSRVLFRIPIELGVRIGGHHRISIAFDHVSNANLADENEGLDTLGLRYGYRF
ncbi:MAG: acyloxyacyl hydrolase [Myxococcales bacterium]|nr:acyloxyacyl hydrolase [Myxococcales bacterium]